ncbi:uncharacterized protein LOC134214260 [Armigeres subalbatus]|uniref:uncharacterized protein LOC134214260 n=1 Tax=Armigeres subalbatus TaxID=124917 RepID=UPI002ED61F98
MKLIIVLVGFICLRGRIQAQTNSLSSTVASAISVSNFNLNITIQQVNNTINSADQTILTSWNQFGQAIEDLYVSYYNRFKNYTTMDLTPITDAICSMRTTISYPPQLMQDDSVSQVFSTVQESAEQVESIITAAATSMANAACVAPCSATKLATCTTKFGDRLTTSPISIDRITDCVAAEKTRYTNIGNNIAVQYTKVLTSAMNYLAVVDVCDTPAPEALNNSSTNYGPPSTQCLTNYLYRFGNTPMSTFVAESMRMPQMQTVSYRMQRCAKLVALDIKDRVDKILESFHNCL